MTWGFFLKIRKSFQCDQVKQCLHAKNNDKITQQSVLSKKFTPVSIYVLFAMKACLLHHMEP